MVPITHLRFYAVQITVTLSEYSAAVSCHVTSKADDRQPIKNWPNLSDDNNQPKNVDQFYTVLSHDRFFSSDFLSGYTNKITYSSDDNTLSAGSNFNVSNLKYHCNVAYRNA